LRRQSDLKLALIYNAQLTQDLPYLDASASLFLDCQTFVELFSGENAHFYQNSAERAASQLVDWREVFGYFDLFHWRHLILKLVFSFLIPPYYITLKPVWQGNYGLDTWFMRLFGTIITGIKYAILWDWVS